MARYKMQNQNLREMRGRLISDKGTEIGRIDEYSYRVRSQSNNGYYEVIKTELGWLCSCPDNVYRGVRCKHVWAVEFSLALRNRIESQIIIKPISSQACLFCSSDNIVKDGIRHNKHGDIQKFNCKVCNRYFTINIGFDKMKHNPQGITTALQLYFSGESLRNTMKALKLLGMEVSHQTVYNWIQKYVSLMGNYLEQIKPKVSDTWRADEVYVKIKGNMKYLFALMDDETRFWIAQEVADSKFKHNARSLFQLGKQATGTKPKILITDGLPAYHDAYLKEFWTARKETRTEHINAIKLQGDKNNNKMERLNGEFRDREKVMRGLKKTNTPIIAGYQLYHNYIRPHEALDGETPAKRAGIEVQGENKWITLIQNASHPTKLYRETNPTKT